MLCTFVLGAIPPPAVVYHLMKLDIHPVLLLVICIALFYFFQDSGDKKKGEWPPLAIAIVVWLFWLLFRSC